MDRRRDAGGGGEACGRIIHEKKEKSTRPVLADECSNNQRLVGDVDV